MSHDYLVSYGVLGDFGRFRAELPVDCHRGDAVVIRTSRGLELGSVLCKATQGHSDFLPDHGVGQLLRLANKEDRQTAEQLQQRGRDILSLSQQWALLQETFVDVLDVEMLLDGRHVILHSLQYGDCNSSSLRATLAQQFHVEVTWIDLSDPKHKIEEEAGSCGDCGSGNCGSCGSSGGCGTGCGSANQKEMQEYFTALREQMHREQRVPLV